MDGRVQEQITPYKRGAEEDPSVHPEAEEISDRCSEDNSSKRLKTEKAAEAQHFERLYETAFEFIQKTLRVNEEELAIGLERLRVSFHYSVGNRFSDNDFTKSENLCAYFRRFSQLSTELSRSKILLALENCEELRSRFNCTTLDVMCIGGGPGFEIVGLLSALHEKTTCRELHLSVVDTAKRWESLFEIVWFLLREGDFGRSCEVFRETNATVKFFGVPAQDKQNKPYCEALNRADIILMKGVLSILDTMWDVNKTMEAVAAGMKKDAILVIIDSRHYELELYNHLEKIFTSISDDSPQDFEIERRHEQMAVKSNAQITVLKKNS